MVFEGTCIVPFFEVVVLSVYCLKCKVHVSCLRLSVVSVVLLYIHYIV